MKQLLYTLIAIILIACGAESISTVSTDLPFEEEKEYEIEVINSVENSAYQNQGRQTKSKINFKVHSISNNIIEGSWQIGETFLLNQQQGIENSEESLSQFRGLKLILQYNLLNDKLEIMNFEEVHGNLKNAFVQYYHPTNDSALQMEVNKEFASATKTDEDLINNYFPEVKVLFNEINKDYVLNQKFLVDSFRPLNSMIYAPIYSSTQALEKEDGELEIKRKESVSQLDFMNRIKNVMIQKHGEAAFDSLSIHKFNKFKYEVEANILTNEENQVSSVEIIKTEGTAAGEKTTRQTINILNPEL